MSFRPSLSEEEGVLEKEKKWSRWQKNRPSCRRCRYPKIHGKAGWRAGSSCLNGGYYYRNICYGERLVKGLKKFKKEGEEKAAIHIAATQVFINDSFPKVDLMARQIFATVSEGEELRTQLMALKNLLVIHLLIPLH